MFTLKMNVDIKATDWLPLKEGNSKRACERGLVS